MFHSLAALRSSFAALKRGLLHAAALSMLALTGVHATDEVHVGGQPNILLILADDLGYGDLGCYNAHAKVPTPRLDQLAREGMLFRDMHSPATVCTPSRYSILTGQMAFRIGYGSVFVGSGGPCLITPDRFTLPQMLRERGYVTALMGKWHVGLTFFDATGERILRGDLNSVQRIDFTRAIPDAPIHRGFDHFFGTACCPTTDFLYAYIDGDRIPVPPTKLLDKSHLPKHPYANDNRLGMIAPDFDLEEVDLRFLEKSTAFIEEHVRNTPERPFFLMHSTQAVHLPSFPARAFKGKTEFGPHGDFLFEFDSIVGRLLDTLERLHIADNTIVIVTSDNGPETTAIIHMRADHDHDGAHPWRGMKRDQWEGGHRVPFLVRWPGQVKPASTSDETLCLTDLMATCAAITSAELPNDAAEDSFDFSPVLGGTQGEKPVREYTLHQTWTLKLAIRRGAWKYLDHQGSGGNDYASPLMKRFALTDSDPDAPAQLYDLSVDPGETNNLYAQKRGIADELKALLEQSKRDGRSAPKRDAR